MRKILQRIPVFCFFLLLVHYSGQAQQIISKPPIDSSVYDKWENIDPDVSITSDGKYVMFNELKGSKTHKWVIRSVDGKWMRVFFDIKGSSQFTRDGKFGFIHTGSDSLLILRLGTTEQWYMPGVSEAACTYPKGLYYSNGNARQFIWQEGSPGGKKIVIEGFENVYTPQNTTLPKQLLITKKSRVTNQISLVLFNPAEPDKMSTIWEGKGVSDIVFDKDGNQIAFLGTSLRHPDEKAIWLYRKGTMQAMEWASWPKDMQLGGFALENIRQFSNDGQRLFLDCRKPVAVSNKPKLDLRLWSFKDQESQLELEPREPEKQILVALSLQDKKFIPLTDENTPPINLSDVNWNEKWVFGRSMTKNVIILNTVTGEKRRSFTNRPDLAGVSPEGNYIVGFDWQKRKLQCYEMATDRTWDPAEGIKNEWKRSDFGYWGSPLKHASDGFIGGWLPNDEGVLIHDVYDVWLIDIKGRRTPVNLTNGYGARNKIKFWILNGSARRMIKEKEELMLVAFNMETKENGYYKLKWGKQDPQKLTVGPYAWYLEGMQATSRFISGAVPVKAADTDDYLLFRQTASSSPDLLVTRDFKNFTQVSDIHPEKNYNWMTTELLEWDIPGGPRAQGVLCKPGNFDPTKKYPVIFYYYTGKSYQLNVCEKPEASNGALNVAWFVSNGYLVFKPDIYHDDLGLCMEESLSCLESAAKMISKLPYVDSTKLGLQGHSWGGILTAYAATQSKLFAAACPAAGLGNYISEYNAPSDHGYSQHWFDSGEEGPAKTLWEDPQWYIRNSPVMNADKVTTPLLIMSNTNDYGCPFVNNFELFSALRRLHKPAWLLEYTKEGHSVGDPMSQKDLDLRMQQFFNYYLKGMPPPVWMTRGVSANKMAIDSGLELDTSGAKP